MFKYPKKARKSVTTPKDETQFSPQLKQLASDIHKTVQDILGHHKHTQTPAHIDHWDPIYDYCCQTQNPEYQLSDILNALQLPESAKILIKQAIAHFKTHGAQSPFAPFMHYLQIDEEDKITGEQLTNILNSPNCVLGTICFSHCACQPDFEHAIAERLRHASSTLKAVVIRYADTLPPFTLQDLIQVRSCVHLEPPALHIAASQYPSMIHWLTTLEDVNARDLHGRTALMIAARDNPSCLETLLDAGAYPTATDHARRRGSDWANSKEAKKILQTALAKAHGPRGSSSEAHMQVLAPAPAAMTPAQKHAQSLSQTLLAQNGAGKRTGGTLADDRGGQKAQG